MLVCTVRSGTTTFSTKCGESRPKGLLCARNSCDNSLIVIPGAILSHSLAHSPYLLPLPVPSSLFAQGDDQREESPNGLHLHHSQLQGLSLKYIHNMYRLLLIGPCLIWRTFESLSIKFWLWAVTVGITIWGPFPISVCMFRQTWNTWRDTQSGLIGILLVVRFSKTLPTFSDVAIFGAWWSTNLGR